MKSRDEWRIGSGVEVGEPDLLHQLSRRREVVADGRGWDLVFLKPLWFVLKILRWSESYVCWSQELEMRSKLRASLNIHLARCASLDPTWAARNFTSMSEDFVDLELL